MKRYVGILRTGTCVLVEMMPIEGSDRCAVRLEGHALRATYTVQAMKETVSLQVGGIASWIALDDIIAERDEALRKAAVAEQSRHKCDLCGGEMPREHTSCQAWDP